MNKKSNKIRNFEEDLKKLQRILDDIESDKLTLEDSIQNIKKAWSCQKNVKMLLMKLSK